MSPDALKGWGVLGSEVMCDTPYLRVTRSQVATPTRPRGVHWMVAHRREAAVIAPQTPEGDFVLIRQERIAVRKETWEFPAGQVDGEANADTIEETALREMGEEAGLICRGELIPLGFFYSSVGFSDEKCHLFLATNVEASSEAGKRDEDEAILEVKTFSRETLQKMVAEGQIFDSNTLAVFARLTARGLI